MNEILRNDLESIDSILEEANNRSLQYLKRLHKIPTGVEFNEEYNNTLPQTGLGALKTLDHFYRQWEKIMVASAGPRYFGYVTGGTTPAALIGDWLASTFDQNTQSTTGPGDISAKVELETISLLLQLLGLPDDFSGGFVTGATMSNFTCLGVARQWAGSQMGLDIAREGLRQDIHVFAATPHSSAIKALALLGMGSKNIKFIKTLPGREAIDVNHLRNELKTVKGDPAILIASGGTVNSGDFDDMQRIAELKHEFNFWWHIDAAFGGFAACSPHYSHLLERWENADSITVDGHKWLNVPYDSGIFLIKKSHTHLQFQNFRNSNAPYLEDPAETFSYLNFLPENSRRFRALPAWFSLMAYGRQGYRDIVENNMKLAQKLGKLIEEAEIFELAAPVRLNIVCFTFKKTAEEEKSSLVKKFLDVLNKRGIAFLTPTVYQNISCIRAALVNWRTTEADIEITFLELNRVYQSLDG